MAWIPEILADMPPLENTALFVIIIMTLLLLYTYIQVRRKRKIEAILEYNEDVFQQVFDVSKEAILILSQEHILLYANDKMVELLGLEEAALSSKFETQAEIRINNDWVNLDTFIAEHPINTSGKILSKSHARLKLSEEEECSINYYMDTLILHHLNNQSGSIVIIQERQQGHDDSGEALRHQFTNLPNQLQAYKDLPAFFSKLHLERDKVALMLLQLDNFSLIRAMIGYEQANDLLKKFAKYLEILSDSLRISIYHTVDNHFLLTVNDLSSREDAIALVKKIQRKVVSFYKTEDVKLHLTISAGIALYPDSSEDVRRLLDYTYKALADAQSEGDGKIHIYSDEKSHSKYDELKLHNDMQQGIENNHFEVYYQPIVNVGTLEVEGAEALIRWKHPEYGFISPEIFIPLMEKTGFIINLGEYVLSTVMKQQKRWEIFKFKQIQVSVNVSMVEIHTGQFVNYVAASLMEHNLDPKLIKFEITEGSAMRDESEAIRQFNALKNLGVGISLDDFGTGYTSFGYLKKFPADNLKIDKSMVDFILTKEEDQRIVKGIIELAHTLGMKIVVEGIESQAMVTEIASYGCDYMQGYYFSKPMPAFEFQKLLR